MFTVQLLKPFKGKVVTYQTDLVSHVGGEVLLFARWNHQRVDLGYVVFEPGDLLYEYFYTDRWYNIFRIHSSGGDIKGWYCNLTRPAVLHSTGLESEDLEIDLFVSHDRSTQLVLDEDEYIQRGIPEHEPNTHIAVQSALAELQRMASAAEGPFKNAEHERRAENMSAERRA